MSTLVLTRSVNTNSVEPIFPASWISKSTDFFPFLFFYYFCLLLALLYLTLIHYRFEMTVECFNLTFIYSSQEFTCIFVKVITKERQEHCVRTEKSKSMQMEPGRLHFHFVVCVPISKLWGHYRLQVFFREAMQ